MGLVYRITFDRRYLASLSALLMLISYLSRGVILVPLFFAVAACLVAGSAAVVWGATAGKPNGS